MGPFWYSRKLFSSNLSPHCLHISFAVVASDTSSSIIKLSTTPCIFPDWVQTFCSWSVQSSQYSDTTAPFLAIIFSSYRLSFDPLFPFQSIMDCSPPGSSVHEIFQARILEWVAISFARGSSRPRDWTRVSCVGRLTLYHWVSRKFTHAQIFRQTGFCLFMTKSLNSLVRATAQGWTDSILCWPPRCPLRGWPWVVLRLPPLTVFLFQGPFCSHKYVKHSALMGVRNPA